MLCRRCLRFALAAFAAGVATAAEARWPALTGDLSGVLRLDALGDSPPLTWSTHVQPSSEGPLRFDLEVASQGLAVHAQVTLPTAADAAGAWRVVDGTIDLATWLPVLLAKAGATGLPSDLMATGTLRLAGEGTWRDADISGALKMDLDGGTAASAAQGWSAGGLGWAAEFALEKNLSVIRTLRLNAGSLLAAGVTARRVAVEAAGVAGGRLEVRRAEVEVFGGRIALAPFTLDPAKLAVDTSADLVGVALGELAALAPQAVAEARGQVAGRVAVRWDAQAGAEPGGGCSA